MRRSAAAVFFCFLFLAACGYVGPVLPPSPDIPNAITNLTVVERGDQILIDYSTPPRTTDNLAVRQFAQIDLRVGETVVPFDFDRWAASATPYETALMSPNDRDDPQPKPMSLMIPVADWEGKRIAVAVRTSTRKTDHFSAWSNRAVIDVLPPLQPPVVSGESTAKGVSLNWKPGSAANYNVFRQGPADKAPLDLGSTSDTFFVDGSSQYDVEYRYTVIAKSGAAESLPSKAFTITAIDKFPPAVPASITALAGPSAIEVSWQRSPDADLLGYYIYRSANNGPYQRQGDLINVPAYTDRQVEHGKTYGYQVSAVDQKGNESAKSSAAETQF